jgi:hypothetical protein
MTPPLSTNQLKILNKEFYENHNYFGRDRLFNLLRDKYGEEISPSRRQIAEFLKNKEINQL